MRPSCGRGMTTVWQTPARHRDRAVHGADGRQGHLGQQDTHPCPGAPSGDPEEAGTGAGHKPSHQPTGRKRALGHPRSLGSPGARVGHTHTDGLPWPLPSAAAEGGTQVRGRGCPPKESKAGILVPRLPIPADQAHSLPLQELSPRPSPQAGAGGGCRAASEQRGAPSSKTQQPASRLCP